MATKKAGRYVHLLPILKKYKGYFLFGVAATIFANAIMLVNPYLIKLAFDSVEAKQPASEIFTLCSYMVILAVIAGVFRFAMRRSVIWASRKVELDLRGLMFTKWLGLDPTYYNNTRTGDLMAHATNDIEAVRMMAGPGAMHMLNAIVSSIISIAFMLTLSYKLTLAAILPMILIVLAVNKLGGLVHKKYVLIQAHFAHLTSRVQENLAGMRVIKAYCREESEIKRFGKVSQKYADMNLDMMKIMGLFHPLIFAVAGLVSLSVLYIGGTEITRGNITLGTLVAFYGYSGWLIWPMIAMGWVISLYQRGTASLDRINKIFETQPNISDPKNRDSSTVSVKGKIEFRNLTFAYPMKADRKDQPETILADISLTVEPGIRLGIIGPTGSGKTSLVSLIPLLYPVKAGQLFIDDIDITLWPLSNLRRGIGFVPQETFLFSDTLEANIDFTSDQALGSGVAQAARLAALHDDVESFPDRYDTILGERGITLSGGQKQRAALARAIMKNPSIIILDDATSSVDTQTEERIFANLEKVLPGRTSIIISHRVSSLKECDRIIYLDNGRVTEEGTHDSLIAANGAYASLYRRQLMEERLEKM
jgi:ATP-binding cassette subfamily B protein